MIDVEVPYAKEATVSWNVANVGRYRFPKVYTVCSVSFPCRLIMCASIHVTVRGTKSLIKRFGESVV